MILQTDEEIKNILFYLWKTRELEGDLIEVGVYQGGSALILDFAKRPSKRLFLFDTFSDNNNGWDGQFDQTTTEHDVREMFPHAVIVKGKFGTTMNSNWGPWAFAHIDVDEGESTQESLKVIYPNMSTKGAIVIHDYLNTGLQVREYTDEFFRLKKEKPIPLTGTTQCVIIKQ